MSDHIATQETINEARACIWNAVKTDPGTRALEGTSRAPTAGLRKHATRSSPMTSGRRTARLPKRLSCCARRSPATSRKISVRSRTQSACSLASVGSRGTRPMGARSTHPTLGAELSPTTPNPSSHRRAFRTFSADLDDGRTSGDCAKRLPRGVAVPGAAGHGKRQRDGGREGRRRTAPVRRKQHSPLSGSRQP
jgi:hypothetical protein